MSYFVTEHNLKRWLDKAQLALTSKNKIRKDLWTDLGDIILFEEGYHTIPISSSEFLTLQSYLQTEGRSDSITNDSFLNWITTLNDLRKKFNREMGSRVQTPEPVEEEEVEHKHATPKKVVIPEAPPKI